jgi:predicted transcriptional regulator of viral defense system
MKVIGRIDIDNFVKHFPPVFSDSYLKKRISEFDQAFIMSPRQKTKIKKMCKLIPIEWNLKRETILFSFKESMDFSPLQFVSALQPKIFLSHLSALYVLGLTDQSPSSIYCSTERVNKKKEPNAKVEISENLLRQKMTKGYKMTNRYFVYNDSKVYIIEKNPLKSFGVKEIFFAFSESEQNNILVTDYERTFIDSVVNPNYSGGLFNVLKSFDNAILDISKLYDYYQLNNFTYPYWQSIGFILDRLNRPDAGEKWEKKFLNHKKIDFYLSKNYRLDWVKSKKWKIFYPGAIDDLY